jgi:hypothetical protein
LEESLTLSLVCDLSGDLYAGTSSGVDKWNGSQWAQVGSVDGSVNTLAFGVFGNLYAGGNFTNADGAAANYISEWTGTNWGVLATGMNAPVNAITSDQSGHLYAGGSFSMAGGTAASNIAEWNGANWLALGSGLDGPVNSVALDLGGHLYAGGSFTSAGGVAATSVAEWNGTNWLALGSGMDAPINALACDAFGNLYAGGAFLHAGGVSVNHLARWNGTNWSALGSGTPEGEIGDFPASGYVSNLVFDVSGNLCVCGNFNLAGKNCSYYVAKALLSTSSYNLTLSQPGVGTNIITAVGTPGYSYALDLTTNLMPPVNWIAQATNTPVGQNMTFTNTTPAPQGFYRTRYVPQ